jgi:signal transduction histidine kinase
LDDVRKDGEAPGAEEFMAVAAHDLRNPIAVVRASAQMGLRQIERSDYDAAQRRLRAIVEQTDRLTELIETFLDAARISADRLGLHLDRSIDLREVIDAAIERVLRLTPETVHRPISVRMDQRCVGAWDMERLVRALQALLSNALLYGVSGDSVIVVVDVDDAYTRVQVTGGGTGPDADESAHLFERFYRGKSAADAGQAGSGLGLFVARGIARGHGGDVRRLHDDVFELALPR